LGLRKAAHLSDGVGQRFELFGPVIGGE